MSQTYHSAVGHGALGFAGTFGALPPLWVSVRRLADLEDIPGGSGAVFAPIRCRTHAYTSTNKTALIQNGFVLYTPPPQTPPLSRFLPHHPAPILFTLFSPQFTLNSPLPTTGWVETRFLLLLCLSLSRSSPLVWETVQICSQTSLRAQEKYRMSACDSSPHCLDCDGAQVTFTPAAHSGDFTPKPGVQLAEVSSLTHRCRKETIALTDVPHMQPFFMITRFH